jgi:hypothetical protein
MRPFTVHIDGDPEDQRSLALAVTDSGVITVGEDGRLRVTRFEHCTFGETFWAVTETWSERFRTPAKEHMG